MLLISLSVYAYSTSAEHLKNVSLREFVMYTKSTVARSWLQVAEITTPEQLVELQTNINGKYSTIEKRIVDVRTSLELKYRFS